MKLGGANKPDDMRIAHGRSIQTTVRDFGKTFLDSARATSTKKSILNIQTWVRQNFSPLVLCFFLSDRDDSEHASVDEQSATAGAHHGAALTDDEKKVQLRATLHELLEQFVVPSVRKAVDSCQDQAVLSQTLVRSLANVRKDWNAFLTTAKFMLISLETESGRSGSNQVEAIFRKAFQDSVFREFRSRLVASLHNLVEQVRNNKADLTSVANDAQELIKQFFDDLNANVASAASAGIAGGSSTTEWAHSETKKLEDFHNDFIEPFKAKMKVQHFEKAQQFEMNNDLPGLLAWIPVARKQELELIRALFANVYPADFELLSNNIMYEFDTKVASLNVVRLIEHNQFGVRHILESLPLENASISWEVKPLAVGSGGADDTSSSSASASASSASTGAAALTSPTTVGSGGGSDDNNVLMNRLRDLYVVAFTAQKASSMPHAIRQLPRTVTRNSRAVDRRIQQGGDTALGKDVEAFFRFKEAIRAHGLRAVTTVVDSLRKGQEFPSEKHYAKELCTNLGIMLKQKAAMVKNLCDNSTDIDRAYSEAFKKYINFCEQKPSFTRKRGDKLESHEHRYPDIVSQYIDTFLTSNDNDDNLEDYADTAIEILSFITDKDIFVEVYRQAISRRFLSKEFTDKVSNREEIVLSRLKNLLPANHVRKCGQGMMDDLVASNTLNEAFQQSPLSQLDGLRLYPRVLGSMNWPQSRALEGSIVWNDSLLAAQQAFARWYVSKHSTRQLRWQPERGNCVVEINFPKAKKEISMTIVQANLLIHLDNKAPTEPFLSQGGMTTSDLVGESGFKADDVDCILMSMIGLSAQHPQILRITGPNAKSKKLDKDQDRLALNPDFISKMKKLNLPPVPSKSGQREGPTDKEIEGWRVQIAEAVIVRIMKSKHTLNHETLVRSAIEHLERSFVAQPAFLKKCIQDLISKEYLERDESDFSCYKYRA